MNSDIILEARERGVDQKTIKKMHEQIKEQERAKELMANMYISQERIKANEN